MRLRSVRARSAVAAAAAAAVMMVCGAVWMRHEVREQRLDAAWKSARMQADTMRVLVDGSWNRLDPALEEVLLFGPVQSPLPPPAFFPGVTYAVVSAEGQLVETTGDLEPFRSAGLSLPTPQLLHADMSSDAMRDGPTVTLGEVPGSPLSGRRMRTVRVDVNILGWRSKSTPQRTFAIYVFATPLDAEGAVAAVDRILLPAVPIAVLLVSMVAWYATRRALRPVEAIRARTASVSAESPKERVTVPDTGDEIAALAVTINETLARLEHAGEMQRRLIADAAHELRSPLTVLIAGLEVALVHPGTADWQDTAGTALAQGRRLQRLTEDLLLMARIDAGLRPGAEAETVVVGDLARAVAGPGVPVHDDAGVTARVVRADLERALRNLIENAVRHATSAVTVTVTGDGETVRVLVADDGPGIAPEDRERVFARFTRLDEARGREHGGSGLGLAITRQLAGRMGGDVRVVDGPGPGAHLRLTLPS
ncbi:sensor histidine kinase [Catenuloplanes japonicus]|uniref:sensor histidine kinase n=1 Tax=Catenuloplanes japonicus TaxID=33876 RepID=UPI0012FC3ED2|nr:HAMP domain-containing sensor histidine kinase [Catenuloplanes japonicus]